MGLLREQYKVLSRGDLDAAVTMFHEVVELEITGPPAIPFLGRWRGRPAVKEAILRNFAMLDSQAPEVHSVVAQGDLVVVAHEQGRDGKIVRLREIVDGHVMEGPSSC